MRGRLEVVTDARAMLDGALLRAAALDTVPAGVGWFGAVRTSFGA